MTDTFDVMLNPFELSRLLHEQCSPAFERAGWEVEHIGPERLVWQTSSRPWWTILLAVLLFPIGLLLLLITHQRRCQLTLVPVRGGSRATVTGEAVPSAASELVQWVAAEYALHTPEPVGTAAAV
jgi:hypothetical protein